MGDMAAKEVAVPPRDATECPRSHGLAHRRDDWGLVYRGLLHIFPESMVTTFSEWLGVKSVEVGR